MAYGTLRVEAGFDIDDLDGLSLYVEELDGFDVVLEAFTIDVPSGTYFVVDTAAAATGDYESLVTGYVSLIATIETLLNASASTQTWTVAYDPTTRRVSFTGDGAGGVASFSVSHAGGETGTGAYGLLGFATPNSGVSSTALVATPPNAPSHLIQCDVGYWSGWSGDYEEDPDAIVDIVAHDGTPHGIAPEQVATLLDLEVPMEPRAQVFADYAASTQPWTWQDLHRHARNVEPLSIRDGVHAHYVRLRREGVAFRPRAITRDWVAYYDIPLRTRLLARRTL